MIDHAGTVNCNKGSHGGFIAQPVSHWEGGDVHPTLNQAHNIGSPGYSNQELFSQKGAGLVPTPFRKSKRACSTTDNETWVPADASKTLNNFDLGDTRTTHAVVQPHIATPMAVRRLTPVECERLQGFPDNWSRISWKGKPEDECPDGPRYKACGNSMAVPCMFWIGSRIAAVNATLSQNHETK
jgi:DNA (cytosine-5)-methyltransferase 1